MCMYDDIYITIIFNILLNSPKVCSRESNLTQGSKSNFPDRLTYPSLPWSYSLGVLALGPGIAGTPGKGTTEANPQDGTTGTMT